MPIKFNQIHELYGAFKPVNVDKTYSNSKKEKDAAFVINQRRLFGAVFR